MNENENSSTYHYTPDPVLTKHKKKSGVGVGKLIAIALVCAILGGALGAGGLMFYQDKIEPKINPEEQVETTPAPTEVPKISSVKPVEESTEEDDGTLSAEELYSANVNATVAIGTTTTTYSYYGGAQSSSAAGSGFIVSEDGFILTCYHVVEDSSEITVQCYDGTSYIAELVGYDSDNDVAVLKIDAEGLQTCVIGNSDIVKEGQPVVAIGNAMGLNFTVTQGIISGVNREIAMSNGETMNLLQTDAAINSGNSGGALFNMKGEVIGITNAKYGSSSSSSSVDNLCFAIPMTQVIDIVNSIMEKGYVSENYIGITGATLSEESTRLGIPEGVMIYSVDEDGPADEAGLKENDVIVKANDTETPTMDDLKEFISNCEAGEKVTFEVYRQGEEKNLEIEVTIGERAKVEDSASQSTDSQQDQDSQNYYYSFPWSSFGFNFGY